jgi:hypothetical protein
VSNTRSSTERGTEAAGFVLLVLLVLAAVMDWWWVVGAYLVLVALTVAVGWVIYVWQNVVKAPKGKRDWEMLFLPVTGLLTLIAGLVYILLLQSGCRLLGPLCGP